MAAKSSSKTVCILGGTGFVGANLTKMLVEKGHQLTLLTRRIREDRPLPPGAEYLEGDPTQEGPWEHRISENEVIINLAGTSIFRRWTKSAKTSIRESRIFTTQNLVDALSSRQGMNTVLLSTSAVGYYGFHEDEDLDEQARGHESFRATDLLCHRGSLSGVRRCKGRRNGHLHDIGRHWGRIWGLPETPDAPAYQTARA